MMMIILYDCKWLIMFPDFIQSTMNVLNHSYKCIIVKSLKKMYLNKIRFLIVLFSYITKLCLWYYFAHLLYERTIFLKTMFAVRYR